MNIEVRPILAKCQYRSRSCQNLSPTGLEFIWWATCAYYTLFPSRRLAAGGSAHDDRRAKRFAEPFQADCRGARPFRVGVGVAVVRPLFASSCRIAPFLTKNHHRNFVRTVISFTPARNSLCKFNRRFCIPRRYYAVPPLNAQSAVLQGFCGVCPHLSCVPTFLPFSFAAFVIPLVNAPDRKKLHIIWSRIRHRQRCRHG